MKILDEMTKDERSLLLFLETCAVDYGGRVDAQCMNSDDFLLVKKWAEEKFIKFGRIAYDSVVVHKGPNTAWVELSDHAWTLAHQERRNRFERINKARSWKKTEEN